MTHQYTGKGSRTPTPLSLAQETTETNIAVIRVVWIRGGSIVIDWYEGRVFGVKVYGSITLNPEVVDLNPCSSRVCK